MGRKRQAGSKVVEVTEREKDKGKDRNKSGQG